MSCILYYKCICKQQIIFKLNTNNKTKEVNLNNFYS